MTINQMLSMILLPLAIAIGILTLQRPKRRIGRETLPALLFALTLLFWGFDLAIHPVYTVDVIPYGLYIGCFSFVLALTAFGLKILAPPRN